LCTKLCRCSMFVQISNMYLQHFMSAMFFKLGVPYSSTCKKSMQQAYLRCSIYSVHTTQQEILLGGKKFYLALI
jgi:hypothetical protein